MKCCKWCGAELVRRESEKSSAYKERMFCNKQCADDYKRKPPAASAEIGLRMELFLELMGLTNLPPIPDGRGDFQGRVRRAVNE